MTGSFATPDAGHRGRRASVRPPRLDTESRVVAPNLGMHSRMPRATVLRSDADAESCRGRSITLGPGDACWTIVAPRAKGRSIRALPARIMASAPDPRGLAGAMVVAVTGASGFTGRAVVAALCARGDAVLALDLWRHAALDARAVFFACDVSVPGSRDAMAAVFAAHRVDCVVHAAALVPFNLPRAPAPGELDAVNVGGTHAVIDACVAAGVRGLVYVAARCASAARRLTMGLVHAPCVCAQIRELDRRGVPRDGHRGR